MELNSYEKILNDLHEQGVRDAQQGWPISTYRIWLFPGEEANAAYRAAYEQGWRTGRELWVKTATKAELRWNKA